jgi:hypothetical protein
VTYLLSLFLKTAPQFSSFALGSGTRGMQGAGFGMITRGTGNRAAQVNPDVEALEKER